MIKPVSPFYPSQPLQTVAACVLFAAMAATILIALGFQYIGGFIPCKLCLMERMPYYNAIPLMLVAAVLSARRADGIWVRGLFLLVGCLMAYGFALSVYHAGAEWKLWPGPADCSIVGAFVPAEAGDLLDKLNTLRPVPCTEAPGYVLGLSMAGWNGVATLGFAIAACIAGLTACNGKNCQL